MVTSKVLKHPSNDDVIFTETAARHHVAAFCAQIRSMRLS